MKTIEKSVLLMHSADEMFTLITDVARYAEFLPWCERSSVLEHTGEGMLARIDLTLAGFKSGFTTRNTHKAPTDIDMQLVEGPFSSLHGRWRLTPLGTDQHACKVEFRLQYHFSSNTLSSLVGPIFDKIANSLVDSFVARAHVIYKSNPQ